MYENSFQERIQWKRNQLGLSQRALADRLGVDPGRMSRLESGQRRPTEQEHFLLCRVLNLGNLPGPGHRPPQAVRTLHDNGRRASEHAELYLPPSDRESRLRLLAAERQWPDVLKPLVERIRRRPDYPYVNFWAAQLSLDSADEALYVTLRLAQGATPALYPPLRLGQLAPMIRCPVTRQLVGHRPFPCLALGRRFEFPQVTLSTPRLHRVDFLVFDQVWQVVEIDGSGHDFSGDAEREEQIGLPTVRFTRNQLIEKARLVANGEVEERCA